MGKDVDIMNIAICDDEKQICELLKDKIQKFYFEKSIEFKIQTYASGNDFVNGDFNKTDVVFLDMDMPGKNGMETAKEIRKNNKEMLIIFLTAYSEFVFESFKVDALRYLVKPVKKHELEETLVAIEQKLCEPEECFSFKFQNEIYSIKYTDIIYIEGMKNKIWIHCKGESYRWRGKMKEISELLKEKGFFYIHQSYIINMNKIIKYNWQMVYLEGGYEIPISRYRLDDFKKEYVKLWSKIL